MKSSAALIILLSIVVGSCNTSDRRQEAMDVISSSNNVSEDLVLSIDPNFYQGQSKLEMEGDPDREQVAKGQGAPRQIIRTGEYRFRVENLDTSKQQIRSMVAAMKGLVQGEEVSDWGDRMALVMRVRVPAQEFDRAIQVLGTIGELENQTVRVHDVTAEWVDLEARMSTKRVLEERYRELVKEAGKVSELLEVERELGKVRSDIESMEAQKRLMADQVAMSTLTITCTTIKSRTWSFLSHAGEAFGSGWGLFQRFIVGLIGLWPFVLFVVGLVFVLRGRLRRRKV